MAHSGTLHRYAERLVAFEHASPSSRETPTTSPTHTLLWVGGLTDGLLTVKYPSAIANSLPTNWRIAEVLISSSYEGFATGSLKRDAVELAQAIKYFQDLRSASGGKIVVMGHSTGCQDIMELVVGTGKALVHIDGAILQSGVSDREAFTSLAARQGVKKELYGLVDRARGLVEKGKGDEVLPKEGNFMAQLLGTSLTAYRTLSLLAKGGDDDYFSSDLEDSKLDRTFGAFPNETVLLILFGELDQYVPAEIDKEGLIGRWAHVVRRHGGTIDEEHSGVVKGAHHNLNGDPEGVVQDLVQRVLGFLVGVESVSKDARL